MAIESNTIVLFVMVCHYGETNDDFLIYGLLLSNATLVACALRKCSHLDWFHLAKHQRTCSYKVSDGIINKESAKICMFVKYVMLPLR